MMGKNHLEDHRVNGTLYETGSQERRIKGHGMDRLTGIRFSARFC